MRIAVDESAREQARLLPGSGVLPAGAASDALHVVVASQHHIKTLLTWNCGYLANPRLTGRLRGFLHEHGLVLPEIFRTNRRAFTSPLSCAQGFEETLPAGVIPEDGFAPVAAIHEVADRPFETQSAACEACGGLPATVGLCQ